VDAHGFSRRSGRWAFPPAFDDRRLHALMVEGVQDIEESLRILLSTRPGERVMHPDYGCGLHRMMFESVDTGLVAELRDLVQKAILFFEPRITLDEVVVDLAELEEGILRLRLDYTIRRTRSRHNWVYPLYLADAGARASVPGPVSFSGEAGR
jgi:phage baseplate assembly protein W